MSLNNLEYPDGEKARARWIMEQRGVKNPVDPRFPYAFLHEEEHGSDGDLWPTSVLFLTNRECPYRCVMCDLWRNTLDTPTPPGAIPDQILYALKRLPPSRQIKLYNAGSFFDPGAIPPSDYKDIARLVSDQERVIVESHPALIGQRTLEFQAMISGKLEVALGLETVHKETLNRLNKRFTLQEFLESAQFLHKNAIALRSFLLVQPPFLRKEQSEGWVKRSLDTAFDAGSEVCSLIPVRGGNGAMESLVISGSFTPPSLISLEHVMEYGLNLGRGRVFADLWEIERLFDCSCSQLRTARLAEMNRTQRAPEPIVCARCSECHSGGVE